MATDNPPADDGHRQPRTLDDTLKILSHPVRRTIIAELEPGDSVDLDDLAEMIADRRSVAEVKTGLVHRHLPVLIDAGIIISLAAEDKYQLSDAVPEQAVLGAVAKSV